MKYFIKALIIVVLLSQNVLSIQIEGKTRKRHPNPLDGIQDLEMVQIHSGVKETQSESEFGHLTLCQANTEFKECGVENSDLISFHKYEREEALLMLSNGLSEKPGTGKTHFLIDHGIVKEARTKLETACQAFESDTQFPRGLQSVEQLKTTQNKEECGVFVYTNSCLWRYILSVKDKPDALNSIDLCRHMLKKVDDLYVQLQYLSTTDNHAHLNTLKSQIRTKSQTLCCDPTCVRCDEPLNKDACETCDAAKNRELQEFNNSDQVDVSQCNCLKDHYLTDANTCEKCKVGCKECTKDECTTCDTDNGFEKGTDKQCHCKSNQFIEETGGVHKCTDCHFSCKTCSEKDKCDTCDTTSRKDIINETSKLCDCQEGRYQIDGSEYCPKCHYSCKTCSRPFDSSASLGEVTPESLENDINYGEESCLTCVDNTETGKNNGREKESGKSSTVPGRCLCKTCHFDSKVDKQCKEMIGANKVCTAASGPDSTDCTDCHTNASKLDSGTCKPNDGYYFDTATSCGNVTKCHLSCLTCHGGDANNCDTCDTSIRTHQSADNTCKCNSGYVPNCDACDLSCETCVGGNTNDCLTCSSVNRTKTLDRTDNGTEIYSCPPSPGYFEKGPKTEEPGKCSPICKTCVDNKDNCLTCYDEDTDPNTPDQFRIHVTPDNKCVCKDGYYQDGTEHVCKKCDETHKKCSSPTHAHDCHDNQNRELNTRTHDCDCKEGYFELEGNPICQQCSERCQTCKDSEHNCTICKGNQSREAPLNGACFCGSHQFWASESCIQCDPSCNACTDTNEKHCINTDEQKAYVEGENVIINHIFILPNNKIVNTENHDFVKGSDSKTIREYIDKKITETITSIHKKEDIAFKELVLQEKTIQEEREDRMDIFSIFYYTPAETNPEQQYFYGKKVPEDKDATKIGEGSPAITNNDVDKTSNVDVALKNVINKAESNPQKYIIYLVVHDITDTTEIDEIKKQLDDIFKENNPKVVSVNVLEIGTSNPKLIPEVKEELQPHDKTSVKGTCTSLEECLDLADKVKEQKETHAANGKKIHNVFITPNSKQSTSPIEVKEIKKDENAKLPEDLEKLIKEGKITIQDITQFTITEIIEEIITREKDLKETDDQEKEKSTVLDYNPTDTKSRFEGQKNTDELVQNELPLSKVDPQTPPAGISDLVKALTKLDALTDSAPDDEQFVVTIFIDGTEDRTPDDIKAILDEIKKLAEDSNITKVNVIEILSEPKNPLLEEVNVTSPKDEDIITSTPNVEELDKVTSELKDQPNPHVGPNGQIHNIFVLPNDKNSNIERENVSVTQNGSTTVPNDFKEAFVKNTQGKTITSVTRLANESVTEITKDIFTEAQTDTSVPQTVTVFDYQPGAETLTVDNSSNNSRLHFNSATTDKTTIEGKLPFDQIKPAAADISSDKPALDKLYDYLTHVEVLIKQRLDSHPNDKFVITVYIDESNIPTDNQDIVNKISEIKEKLDQYGIVNIITILSPNKEPDVSIKIKNIVSKEPLQPVKETTDKLNELTTTITEKLKEQIKETLSTSSPQEGSTPKKVKHVILTPNDAHSTTSTEVNENDTTKKTTKIREEFNNVNVEYTKEVASNNASITDTSNKQSVTIIDYSESEAAADENARRVNSHDPVTDDKIIATKLNIDDHPDKTGKAQLKPELKKLLDQIKDDPDSEYIVTIQVTDDLGKGQPEIFLSELKELIDQLEDQSKLPNVTVNVVEFRVPEQPSSPVYEEAKEPLTETQKPLQPIVETVTTIEEITEVLKKIEEQTEKLPSKFPQSGDTEIFYRFIVPNTKNARVGTPASELKEDKNSVIPKELEDLIKNVEDQVSPQIFAQSVIQTVVDQLRQDESKLKVPKVTVDDYKPSDVKPDYAGTYPDVKQRISKVTISQLTNDSFDLSKVTPATITSRSNGNLKDALVQAATDAKNDKVTIITVFIDHNKENPLTEKDIEEITNAIKTIVGYDENVPVINIITIDFEPEEDLADKIEEQTTPQTIPGIKEEDDTIEDVNDTIDKLKKQQESVPEPKADETIHNIFLIPNTLSSRENHPVENIKETKDSSLPTALNKTTVTISQIIQYLFTEVVKHIVTEEKDITEADKSKLSIIDYNVIGVTKRLEGKIPTDSIITTDLPLDKQLPTTVTGEGVGNITAALEQAIKDIRVSTNEKFLVTLFVDGSKPLTEAEQEKIAQTIKELQDDSKVVTFNIIVIETKEKELVEEIAKELVPEERPGQLTSCTTAVECNDTFEELKNKIPVTQDISVDITYYVLIIQNTSHMNTPVEHTTDRFKPLDTKRDITEYTTDSFVTQWTIVNHESKEDIPLNVIFVNESGVQALDITKNLPGNFELNYPEKTEGDKPNFTAAITKLLEIINHVKEQDKYNKIEFRVTILGADKDLNDQNLTPDDVDKLKDQINADGVENPKIVSLDIIRLQDPEETNTTKLEEKLEPLEETPGQKTNTSTPDEFYELVTSIPSLPTLPSTPQVVQCALGYYKNPDFKYRSDQYCLPCHKTCKSCEGPLKTDCTSCSETDNRVTQGSSEKHECPCKTGHEEVDESKKCFPICTDKQYRDTSDNTCKDCHETCHKCTGPTAKECSECKAGEYKDANSQCQNCDEAIEHCKECSLVDGSVQCNQCTDNINREVSEDKKACNCESNFKQEEEICKIQCSSTEFRETNTKCTPCSPKCLTCDKAADSCTSCNESDHHRELLDGKCNCKDTHYDDGSNDPICKSCQKEGCLECNSAIECTKCDESKGFKADPISGKCVCKDHHGFEDSTKNKCVPCHENCQQCQLGNQNGKCSECDEGREVTGTGSDLTCGNCIVDESYYEDATTKDCKKCHFSCKTCTGGLENNCLTCNENRTFNETAKTCPPCEGSTGTEEKKGTAACFETGTSTAGKCDITCKQCNGPTNKDCLKCHDKFDLQEDKSCDPTDFHTTDPEDPTRPALCDKSCGKECTNTSANGCTECLTDFREYISSDNSCQCKDRTYSEYDSTYVDPSKWSDPNKSFCKPCHYSCLTCSDDASNSCKTCDATKKRIAHGTGENKECKCNSDATKHEYYYDDGDKVECTECVAKRQVGTEKLCRETDPGIYIPNKGTETEEPETKDCHYTCYTCNGSAKNQCTECKAEWNREQKEVDGGLECPPKEGHFEKPDEKVAPPCDYHCKTCAGPEHDQCLDCDASKNFKKLDPSKDSNTQGKCKATDGHYDDKDKENGEPCHRSCSKCLSEHDNGCTECRWKEASIKTTSTGTLNGQSVQHGKCEPNEGHFIPEKSTYPPEKKENPDCLTKKTNTEDQPFDCWMPEKCDENCVACEQAHDHCTECDNSKNLILKITATAENSNTCVCAQGYYKDGSICKACKNECLTCQEVTKCTKCKGNFTQVAAEGTCECITGTEKVSDTDINCKPISKPNVVIPGEKGDVEEEDEQCIVIKKIASASEGSSGIFSLVQIAEAMRNHKKVSPVTMIQSSSRAFNRTRRNIKKH